MHRFSRATLRLLSALQGAQRSNMSPLRCDRLSFAAFEQDTTSARGLRVPMKSMSTFPALSGSPLDPINMMCFQVR